MERHSMNFRFRQAVSIVCVSLMTGMGTIALAQTPAPPQAQVQGQSLPPQQLENLVAPIALYPDPLLGQVLAASTYPVELVEAQQWLQANGNLHGQELTDAARQQNWDASVQALVAMPDVLAKLNQDIRWSTDLGNAFLAQPADVMAAVQRLRGRAQANGKLQSGPQETVTTQTQNGQQAIEIQPADPQVIYVPTYDPAYIWGPPAWGYYPPLYYPAFGFGWYPGFNIGLCFGGWGGWGWGGWGWGWGPNWFGGGLFINAGFFNRYGYHNGFGRGFGGGFRGTVGWAHDPGHRLGAGYSTAALNNRYGAASQASRISSARAGNFHSFGQSGGSYRAPASQASARSFQGGRSVQGTQGGSSYQRFQSGRQSYSPPAQRSGSPAMQQRSSAPAQRYSAPAQRSGAPAMQHYSAPAQHYSAPHYSAPSGGARSSGGGGARSFGGGGGGHSSGGGHGGGGRR
jgi:hypothetical protein